jgi:hypothetical protein
VDNKPEINGLGSCRKNEELECTDDRVKATWNFYTAEWVWDSFFPGENLNRILGRARFTYEAVFWSFAFKPANVGAAARWERGVPVPHGGGPKDHEWSATKVPTTR